MVHSSGLLLHLIHNLLWSCDELVSLVGVVTRDREIYSSEYCGGGNTTIYLNIVIRLITTFHRCCRDRKTDNTKCSVYGNTAIYMDIVN